MYWKGGFMLAGPDVLVILAIALVVFGGKRISDLGTGLGKGIRNFKKSMEGDDENTSKKSDGKS
jgi:sec-independent protein translocase protein TatA